METSETRTGRSRLRRESSARYYNPRKEHAPSPVMEVRRWRRDSKEDQVNSSKRILNRRAMSASEYVDSIATRPAEYRAEPDLSYEFAKIKLHIHDLNSEMSETLGTATDMSSPGNDSPVQATQEAAHARMKRDFRKHCIHIVHNYMKGNVPLVAHK
mmetsp:Transcript_21654/g.37283  ORF Transcript_21654/g.37283 Transcript_21654/m.37283 type:complete len:157 (+) Transcript_21654:74-544(+)